VTTVLVHLVGPIQAWADGPRAVFETRRCGTVPSLSGVLGLIMAAMGAGRDDDEMLARLAKCAGSFAVRVDREGRKISDYHSVGGGEGRARVRGAKEAVLTRRDYLHDAAFVAALGFEDEELAARIDEALDDPTWLLYLGRKSCPLSRPPRGGLLDADPETALRQAPWTGDEPPAEPLRLVKTCAYGQGEPVEDVPLSFRPEATYRRRWVEVQWIQAKDVIAVHDPAEPDPPSEPVIILRRPRVRRKPTRAPSLQASVRPVVVVRPAVQPSTRIHQTRMFLNPLSADARADVEDCHRMHVRVMSAFPRSDDTQAARAFHGVLHHIDRDPSRGRIVLHVQSVTAASWHELPRGYAMDLASSASSWTFGKGDVHRFELRANPYNRSSGETRQIVTRVDLHDWFDRVAAKSGFEVLGDVEITPDGAERGDRPETGGLTFYMVRLAGVLRVTDGRIFPARLTQGFGYALPYGGGLMRLTPVTPALAP
jgi:CRISPR system Cascade subunit CasD